MNYDRAQRTKDVGVVLKDVYPVLFTHQRFEYPTLFYTLRSYRKSKTRN